MTTPTPPTYTDPCTGVRYRLSADGRAFEWENPREEPGVWAVAVDRPAHVRALAALLPA